MPVHVCHHAYICYTCSCSYLFQFGPVLTEGNEAYIHHLLIYQCNGLSDTHVDNSGECDEVAGEIQACRGGIIVALWVAGLEVSHYAILNTHLGYYYNWGLYHKA